MENRGSVLKNKEGALEWAYIYFSLERYGRSSREDVGLSIHERPGEVEVPFFGHVPLLR